MSTLDDIFDLPEGSKQYMNKEDEPKQVITEGSKKQRKKPELSEEKKVAMLERLRAGREKRQENLKAKKEPKEEPKEPKEVKKKKEVVKKTDTEAERLSFITMMAGKSKPVEKYERPKKKVQSIPKEEVKEEKKKEEPKEKPISIVPTPIITVASTREPVVIRTFKKPLWG